MQAISLMFEDRRGYVPTKAVHMSHVIIAVTVMRTFLVPGDHDLHVLAVK